MSPAGEGGSPAAALLRAYDGPALDRLAWLGARAVGAPSALVVLVDGAITVVVGQAGRPDAVGREAPPGSFARRVATQGASADPDALRGAWEADALGARAALGFPVAATRGAVHGALVVLDAAERAWTEEESEAARIVAGLVSDELDRKDAQARLLSAESYRYVMERSPEAILVHVDGVIRYANPAAVSLLGARGPEDLLTHSIDLFLTQPYLKHVEDLLRVPRPPCAPPPVSEEQMTRLDGTVRYVELAAHAYLAGDSPAVQIFLRDVTDRREAREALRAREAHLRLLLERIPALHWTTDLSLRMNFARPGTDPSPEGTRTTVEAFFGKGEDAVPVTTHRRALAGESASGMLEWEGAEYEVRVDPLRDEGGAIVGTVGIALDTTVRRRAEARDRDARELYRLGRLAGGVAHGVNNVLATIVGTASVMSEDAAVDPEVRRNLEIILDAGERARTLTANLLGYAQQGRYRAVRMHLNDLASEAADWTLNHRRRVFVELASGLPTVTGEPAQLRQAVLHICQNALDATRAGGEVRIVTRRAELSEADPALPDLAPGVYACLEIRDDGHGMSEEVRARAIEPFFTTKEGEDGVGMGLPMAHGVLLHHGGGLHIASTPGEGTTVSLYLPAADEPPPPPAAPAGPGEVSLPGTDRKVALVVDDDEWVLYSSSLLLKQLGYEVIQASSGPAGLDEFVKERARIAFVLLDLRMPGMDGEEVLRRLLALDPDARVILCTGYERDQVSQRLFASGRVGFLGKPFNLAQLRAQIGEVCGVGV